MRRNQTLTEQIALARLRELTDSQRLTRMSESDWLVYLRQAYPVIDDARRESSRVAREYYDMYRQEFMSGTHEIDLASYSFQRFAQGMEKVREDLSEPEADSGVVDTVEGRMQREIRNANRGTQLRAVETDEKCIGWARVGTGSSCYFCLMLLARGAVYKSEQKALRRKSDGRRFHDNCDCLAVPIFDTSAQWDGKDEFFDAKRTYNRLTKGYQGKKALLVLRRRLEGRDDPD